MRYLPMPIGQRPRTWAEMSAYSFTRPLMEATAFDTFTVSPPKILGRLAPPRPTPSALGACTAPREPTEASRSPTEDR